MTATEKRAEAVRLMKSRVEKNTYTQGGDRIYFFGKPEGASKGYSDCSSSVRACIKKAAGIDIGGNTSAQISNRGKGIIVEDNRDGKRSYPTLSKLLPADCVYYKGNVGHAWSVGHVEMVTGDDICHGHGSGIGPTKKKSLKAYSQGRTGSRKYLCTIRWIKDDASTTTAPVVPADPVKNPTAVAEEPKLTHGIKITGASVNLRTGPSTDYAVVDTVKAGEIFEDASLSGWFPIVVNGRVLWVSDKMAKKV